MKKKSIYFILLLVALFVFSCKYDFILPEEVPDNGGNPISFATQVAPIFSNGNKCTACHKPGATSPDLTTANAYMQILSKYVNTANPEASLILTMPGSNKHSWKGFTAGEASVILTWIKEGANNN
jgi:hypothetical protein